MPAGVLAAIKDLTYYQHVRTTTKTKDLANVAQNLPRRIKC